MKIELDLDSCLGYGNCVVEAPDLFDLDEDRNIAVVLVERPSDEQVEDARRAVQACPAAALRLVD